jgi:hypothetical protein
MPKRKIELDRGPEEIRLSLDIDRITLNDLILLEEQNGTARDLRDFLGRCAVDAEGTPLGEEEAGKIVGTMPLGKIRDLLSGIGEALQGVGQVPLHRKRS